MVKFDLDETYSGWMKLSARLMEKMTEPVDEWLVEMQTERQNAQDVGFAFSFAVAVHLANLAIMTAKPDRKAMMCRILTDFMYEQASQGAEKHDPRHN